MSNGFISDIANSFKPGSMTNPVERNVYGIAGIVGLVSSIALAVFGAPALLCAFSAVISATLVASALMESRGLAYTALIGWVGLSLAAAALTPMPTTMWVVY